MTEFNYGDAFEQVALAVPGDTPALIHGQRTITWDAFDKRTNRIARYLRSQGLQSGDKVGFYLRNSPAYAETLSAVFKGRLTHVNINYRYVDEELYYILDNADCRALVYDPEFAEVVVGLRNRLLQLNCYLETGESDVPSNDFAKRFESVAETGNASPLNIERSPEDVILLYTGGTTGMPKGVIWEHKNMWDASLRAQLDERPRDLEHFREMIAGTNEYPRVIPACPQMHGTGMITTYNALARGGCVITLTSHSFDAEELLRNISEHAATQAVIVGDVFARPMLETMDQSRGRFRLDSLESILSSGVMWSPAIKQGLLSHHPRMRLIDTFGSSEAIGFGNAISTREKLDRVARFSLGRHCKVFSEDLREIRPGSDEPGLIARSGPIPLGYYKDPEKTARTFVTIDGVRYSMPGDWCTVNADGTLNLLGRGSACINSGGEKIYPEEIEEVLKTHPDVEDALVVGLADEKWGQAVTGIVQMRNPEDLDDANLKRHVRQSLAPYKIPKHIFARHDLLRAPNGKADYKAITQYAETQLKSQLRRTWK